MNTLNHSIVMNESQYYGLFGFMYLIYMVGSYEIQDGFEDTIMEAVDAVLGIPE